MAQSSITKVGALTNDVVKQINDNFTELYAASAGGEVTVDGVQTLTNKTLTAPVLTTPTLGVAVATSINAVTITAPAAAATLTIANNKTLTVSNILTLAGTDSTVMTFPTTSATIARTDAANTFTGVQTMTSAALTTPTVTNPTVTTGTFASPVVTGDASGGVVVSKTVAFVEDATSTTFTGTVVIPAGATLVDIVVTSSVLWSKASSRFTCGDTDSANGWFTSTNLNATDLLVGERLSAASGGSQTSPWGGVNGAYLVATTGRWGQATASKAGPYYVTAGNVIGVCTVTPGAGTAGRTFMTVTYAVGQPIAAVLA